ncbi:hypothetical protein DPMN_053906 [Dreissena polymorpha]|uniref:Uncharacterized protein n=1 Tax=Dreissena polymorpha TaxID=45954 RepID=A0A9D4HR58_DREPO|nr:hypothetical protein DPMN_053906 [Dreissena polymorpha]
MTLHHPCNRPCWQTKSSDEAITFSINSCNIFEKRPAPQRFTQAHWQDMMRKIKHEAKRHILRQTLEDIFRSMFELMIKEQNFAE